MPWQQSDGALPERVGAEPAHDTPNACAADCKGVAASGAATTVVDARNREHALVAERR
jgi:hypothetical protein